MNELIKLAGTYAGEILIMGVGLLIRSIEKKIIIRRNRRKWERGELYSKIDKKEGDQSKR